MFASSVRYNLFKSSHRAASVESFKVMDVLQRANQLVSEGKDVVHCEIGQPGTGAPACVAQAAVHALTEPQVMGYTNAFGLLELRQKIATNYQQYYQQQQPPSIDQIVITTGSSGAFLLAFHACFDAGDTVALASSGYPCYRNILSAVGCQLASIPINADFKITAQELENEMDRRKQSNEPPLKGLILSSPSNPTGAMLDPVELKDLCELCDQEGMYFLSDEIYHGISYGKQEATALQYSENAIVINSFSKYYSMSGWRLGWMVIPKDLIEPINSLQQNMFINAPTISQTAALKCWDDETIVELEGHVQKYRASRQLILETLANLPGLDPSNIAPADGGFYVYIDLGENVFHGLGSVQFCNMILEEEYVALTAGVDFEDPATDLGDRRFRISYAAGIEPTRKAMKRLQRFWPQWIDRVKTAKAAASA